MAKTTTQDYTLRRGKLNKKDDIVYRVRNEKQQTYTPSKNTTPPSEAQDAHRKLFGKITSIVNAIMTDPAQAAEWQIKMEEYNRLVPIRTPEEKFVTVRQFVYASIKAQLLQDKAIKRRRKGIQKALPKGYKMHIKPFAELSTTELYELLKARFEVFYLEQKIVYPDLDDVDYHAVHLALHRKGKVIAYARLYKGKKANEWHIGRMLTTERGQGFGKYIMEQTIAEAERLGAKTLLLHAQMHAVQFYKKFGFATSGDIFTEADIPHVLMTKSLV